MDDLYYFVQKIIFPGDKDGIPAGFPKRFVFEINVYRKLYIAEFSVHLNKLI